LWFGEQVELYYMRNRWYEPRTGRFLSEDPIGLAGGINPYVFAGADPVNGWDPRGLIAIRQCEIDGTCGREDGAAERYEDMVEETNPFDANSGGEMTGGPAGRRPAAQESQEPFDLVACGLNVGAFLGSAASDLLGGWLVRTGIKSVSRAGRAWRYAQRYYDAGKVDAGFGAVQSAAHHELARDAANLGAAAVYAGGVRSDFVFANNPNHMPSETFTDSLLDVLPVTGSARAFGRAVGGCF
jgi:RHS repeat-associated protein